MLFKFRWIPWWSHNKQLAGGTGVFSSNQSFQEKTVSFVIYASVLCDSPLLWTLLLLWTLDQSDQAPTLEIFCLRKNFKVIMQPLWSHGLNFVAVRFPDTFGGSSSQLGLERIVLSANGNLQRVMSAYYNRCKLSPHWTWLDFRYQKGKWILRCCETWSCQTRMFGRERCT